MAASKQKEYTGIIQKHGEWWIGWVKEVPGVNCQEHTYEELIESLHLGLKDILEYDKEQSDLDLGHYSKAT